MEWAEGNRWEAKDYTLVLVKSNNQEILGGLWVFPRPTHYFTDLLAAESG